MTFFTLITIIILINLVYLGNNRKSLFFYFSIFHCTGRLPAASRIEAAKEAALHIEAAKEAAYV